MCRNLNVRRVRPAFEKIRAAIEADDVRAADVEKLDAELAKYPAGFFADPLRDVLSELPPWLWADKRRKRSCVNQVLARAEVHSAYMPARRLWVRVRNGHDLPNPDMQLCVGGAWRPVYDLLAAEWIDRGCGGDSYTPRLLSLVERAREAVSGGAEELGAAEAVPPPT